MMGREENQDSFSTEKEKTGDSSSLSCEVGCRKERSKSFGWLFVELLKRIVEFIAKLDSNSIFAALHLLEFFFLNFNIHREISTGALVSWWKDVSQVALQKSGCSERCWGVVMSSVNLKYHTVIATSLQLNIWCDDEGSKFSHVCYWKVHSPEIFSGVAESPVSWRRIKLFLEAVSCTAEGVLQWAKCFECNQWEIWACLSQQRGNQQVVLTWKNIAAHGGVYKCLWTKKCCH